MPPNSKVEKFVSPFVGRRGQAPITRVRPLESALTVKVLAGPSPEQVAAKFGPTHAAHALAVPEPSAEVLKDLKLLFQGKGLWQMLEMLEFDLLIEGCSRIFTHQLVRTRIGVTFSQQGTGDGDCRHMDLVMPSAYPGPAQQRAIAAALNSKLAYVDLVDGYHVPEQDARYLLPHCLGTFIYMHANLACLSGLYKKRTCVMTQAWETHLFAEKLKAALVKHSPWTAALFGNPCESGNCWYQNAKDTPFAVSHLWRPDEDHDGFEWNPASFFYGDHEECSTSYPVDVQYYKADDPCSKREWQTLWDEYTA